MEVKIKRLQGGDESAFSDLVALFNEEFGTSDENAVNDHNIRHLLGNPEFVCMTAYCGQELAGGLTGYALRRYDGEGFTMYLYDIAVASAHQRRGIGSRLVAALIDYCKANAIADLFVQADANDTHAVRFYEKIGGEPSEACQFSFNRLLGR